VVFSSRFVNQIKVSAEALAEKAIEAAVEIKEPVRPVVTPLGVSYLDDIPSFIGN